MGSYGALWRARFDMMRPGNGLMVILAVWLGAAFTVGGTGTAGLWLRYPYDAIVGTLPIGPWIAAPLAAFFINGFGNVMNDLRDHEIDRIAHPERPLPSGAITVDAARSWAGVLLAAGFLEAYVAGGWVLVAFAGVNALALVAYEWRLKALPLVGNIVIAALVASAFAFGAVSAGATWTTLGPIWWIMGMVALVNIAREILKDLEDAHAEPNRRTIPQVLGPKAAAWTASGLVGIAVGLDAAAILRFAEWMPSGRIVLTLAGIGFVAASGIGCARAGLGQRALKWVMLIALVGFILAVPAAGASFSE